jgi:hypothetical protein
MTAKKNYSEAELRYNEIHSKLMELKLYLLADELSSTFYGYGTEQYHKGIEVVKEIYKL